jgi:hypothetical protein
VNDTQNGSATLDHLLNNNNNNNNTLATETILAKQQQTLSPSLPAHHQNNVSVLYLLHKLTS